MAQIQRNRQATVSAHILNVDNEAMTFIKKVPHVMGHKTSCPVVICCLVYPLLSMTFNTSTTQLPEVAGTLTLSPH